MLSPMSDKNKENIANLYFFFAGYQLLSRSRSPRCDYSRSEGAHTAATHFPPGAGSWGKVPYQVSCLKNLSLPISRWEGNSWEGNRREEQNRNEKKRRDKSARNKSRDEMKNRKG